MTLHSASFCLWLALLNSLELRQALIQELTIFGGGSGIFCFLYSISRLSIFNIQRSMFNIQTSVFNIQTSIFRLPYLCYFHYLNNYDLPLYSLFFCKSHVRYCSLPRHNAFLCNEYYLEAEVVQKISNYKQNMLLFNCNRVSYLLVNVGRKRLELHSVA